MGVSCFVFMFSLMPLKKNHLQIGLDIYIIQFMFEGDMPWYCIINFLVFAMSVVRNMIGKPFITIN